jgi:hypothetical protein
MPCTVCNCPSDLAPDETFCGKCGHAASAHAAAGGAMNVPAPTFTPPVETGFAAPAFAPPAQQGTYRAEISRRNPACLLFLVDQSGSMDEPIAGGAGEKKKNVVADAINRLIYNLVLRCGKEGGVLPYFDIGVWSYAMSVQPAFGSDLVSISQINERARRMEMRKRRVPDGAGGVYEEEMPFPIWFDAAANGMTPMHAAFSTLVAPLQGWLAQHQASFPPIIINLTDGAYTDSSPAPVARQLMQLSTADGNVLVFNCHISNQAGASVQFPGDRQAGALTGLARELYEISSPMPEPMCREAANKGYQLEPGARGYAFNADLVTMIDFLEIGTRVVQDRAEQA